MPVNLAFQGDGFYLAWFVVDIIVDVSFAVDIAVNFFSAYYDAEMALVDSRRVS